MTEGDDEESGVDSSTSRATRTGQSCDESVIFTRDDARVAVEELEPLVRYDQLIKCLSFGFLTFLKQLGFLSGCTIRPGSNAGCFMYSS